MRQSAAAGAAAAAAVASGLLLDVAIAATFGADRGTDAYFVAARIPLGLIAIASVAANQVLVPAFATSFERDGEDATWGTASILLWGSLIIGCAFAGLAVVLARPIVAATAPGLSAADADLAAALARITFFVVPLAIAAEILRSLLNAS
jgi:putative peptidoglycan lipid II flippase